MLPEVRSVGARGLTLLTDSAAISSRRVLHSLIVASVQRAERVHVFTYETPVEEFLEGLPQEISSSLTLHDGFSNPLHWARTPPTLTLRDLSVQGIRQRVGDAGGPHTIVLDSLSWILARCPLPSVCRLLRELSAPRSQPGDTCVVALLHADLHDPGVLSSVRLLADTDILLTDPGGKATATVTHRKPSGRVLTQVQCFQVHDDFSLDTVSEDGREPDPGAQLDPTINLTFNLRLSEKERSGKESATLPYTFTDRKKLSLLHSSSGSARIFYDPDPSDAADDEDPDDDLDV
ncbi:elongator complex protein 5 [Phyllobates terribilis]|uniref:elongator complex protein 5 n=1 Tax=Phyllobates terribilis TaxID=111132 RepID=UPI003CCB7320